MENPKKAVDLEALNKYATRETHHTPWSFHQARSVPAKTKKTVFDACNGYYSVPIRKEDRCYKKKVSGILNKTKCINDTVIWSESVEESFHQGAN